MQKTTKSSLQQMQSFRRLKVTSRAHDRGHWESHAEFILSCIGLSVGLGNLWRFPTLAFENGGAAFFIPYVILQLAVGQPMYFMELVLGQYAGLGPALVFRCNPAARGVGISMVCATSVVGVYYIVIMAYALFYMFGVVNTGVGISMVCATSVVGVYYIVIMAYALFYMFGVVNTGVGISMVCATSVVGVYYIVIMAYALFYMFGVVNTGVGISMVCATSVVGVYYIVIMAYALFYMFESMQRVLPWVQCKPSWVVQNCYSSLASANGIPLCGQGNGSIYTNSCRCTNRIQDDFDATYCPQTSQDLSYTQLLNLSQACPGLLKCTNDTRSPSDFYFNDEVIQRSDTLANIGTPIWHLTLCLLLSWTVVVLCLLRGIRWSGKVVYFTATFPYVVLVAMLSRGLTLEGSLSGIKFFLVPTWSKLTDIEVWRAAGSQMFFSLSVSFGAIITLSSYNQFRNNIYIDAILISFTDLFTSFLSGLVVFSTLGYMAQTTGVNIDHVTASENGLAFVTYPQAIAQLPTPQFWAFIFFLMLFTLGVDSEFALVETILTAIAEVIPITSKYKVLLCITTCIAGFILGLPLVTPGGEYILEIMDRYCTSYAVYAISICEVVAIAWGYGTKRFLHDIYYMMGYRPEPVVYWRLTWSVLSPVILFAIMMGGFVKRKVPKYASGDEFEPWVQALGWVLLALVLAPIPVVFVMTVLRAPVGPILQRISWACRPAWNWEPQYHEP